MVLLKQASITSSIIFLVRYTGLWHTEKKNNSHPVAMLAVFCFISSYIFQVIALIIFKNDIELEFEIFSVISFCGMGILKLLSLSFNRELWLSLLNKMNDLEKQQLKGDQNSTLTEYESDNESNNIQILDPISNYTKKFKRAATILFKMYSFTCVIFILSPFIVYVFALFRGKKPEKYPHILPSWNPFDNIHVLCYLITVTCEAVAAVYCVYIHIAFDATAIGVMIFVCGQFSSLISRSEMIGGRGQLCWLSKRRDIRAHSRIINCHKIHVELVRCIQELDTLLKNTLGFYFFLATLTLCSVAVRLKTECLGAMQLVSLLQYMCATLTQLYIYCSYGDAVCIESSVLAGQGPYGAAIWCLCPRIRREIVMLGIGMMKQRRLHAGPFNTLNLQSFIQIVRAAYSYYAVLGGNESK